MYPTHLPYDLQYLNRPVTGKVVRWDSRLDMEVDLSIRELTFASLNSVMESGAAGDLSRILRTLENLELRDPQIKSVASTRRKALTGLEWDIVSTADDQVNEVDKNLADEAAEWCKEKLNELHNFKKVLKHLAKGIGPNISVVENVWNDNGQLEELSVVKSSRLTMHLHQSPDIRIRTMDEPLYGIPATGMKWIVHIPEPVCGSPLMESISFTCAIMSLSKLLSVADWMVFLEKFGMPIRVGTFPKMATDKEKKSAEQMLQNMGSDLWALVSEGFQFELKEASNLGQSPYEAYVNYVDKSISKLWLGGNLTSDTTGGTGTLAAGKVHNQVRHDILEDDVENEALTIDQQLIAPMVKNGFDQRAPVPHFQRVIPEQTDENQVVDRILKMIGGGIPLSQDYVYDALNIPKPKEGEPIITPIQQHPVFENDFGRGDGFTI